MNDPHLNAAMKNQSQADLVCAVAARAENELGLPAGDVALDLLVAGKDVEMDLERLLNFRRFDFAHDLLGIASHLNRETGKIEHCFLPRCAK